jgi:isopentenyl phosphate kinase
MLDHGIDAVSIQPSACCLSTNNEIDSFFLEPISRLLEQGIVPVPYGDSIVDTVRGASIVSTEQLLAYIAKHLKPTRIVVFGIVDGVYTEDPQKTKDAELISEITPYNYPKLEHHLRGSPSVDVTGGMLTKVRALLDLVGYGIQCEIVSGVRKGYVRRALGGETGLGTVVRS